MRQTLTASFVILSLMLSALAQAEGGDDNGSAHEGQSSAPQAPANSKLVEQSLKRAPLPLRELRTFTEIFDRIRASYVEEVDDKTLLEYAINGMLTNLDPHSDYLLAEDFSELQESTSGKFGGLGIEVGIEDGLLKVISPIDDTPAKKAGILAGDLIITLDGEPIRDMSLRHAIDKMRGEPGSPVSLDIRREGNKELLHFSLKRAEIKIASVRGEALSPEIGYLRISQFQDQSGEELNRAIRKLQQGKDRLDGLILDLRNNPGGVLEAAVAVSDAFIDEGLIVYTQGRIPQADVRYQAKLKTQAADTPLIVLINGGSASASEIVAGALQDHKRAIILGTPSFGKGSVQSVLPIGNDKAIKLTTARYFTPLGRSIQAQGIHPDVYVEQSEVTPIKQKYYKERDLSGHISNPGDEEEVDADIEQEALSNRLLSRDFQLHQAYTLLQGFRVFNNKSETENDREPKNKEQNKEQDGQ